MVRGRETKKQSQEAEDEDFTAGKEIDYYKILGWQEYRITQIANSFSYSRTNNKQLKKAIRMYEGSIPRKLRDGKYMSEKQRVFEKLGRISQDSKNAIEEYYDSLIEWFNSIQDVLHRHGILIPVRTKILV